jgi:predicted RNA-binding protein
MAQTAIDPASRSVVLAAAAVGLEDARRRGDDVGVVLGMRARAVRIKRRSARSPAG